MPLVPGADPTQLGPVSRLPEPQATPEGPGFLDVAASAERQSNLVGSLYDRLSGPSLPDTKPTPGFDAAASVPKGYESFAERFLDADSPEQIAWTKGRIDHELQDKQTIARAGKWGFAASMAAGLTDPITLASMALPGGGETRLGQAASLATIGGATSAVQEGLQQQLMLTRTPEESALNVAGSTVLGGILGAAIRPHVPTRTADALGARLSTELHTDAKPTVLGPEQRGVLDTALPSDHPEVSEGLAQMRAGNEAARLSEAIPDVNEPAARLQAGHEALAAAKTDADRAAAQKVIEGARGEVLAIHEGTAALPEARPIEPMEANVSSTEEHINPNAESTAGAAAVAKPTMEGETIARGAKTLAEGPIGRVAPGLRILSSDSLEARRLVQELANTPEMLEKNMSGVPTAQPVERALWKYEGTWWQGLKARGEAFKTYRERMAGAGEAPLSRRDFGVEVSRAMRRGDVHDIPEVAQAAKDTRRLVFDPLKVRAQKAGLLPEEVQATGADSYLTRQYDARAIRGNLGKWLDTLTEGFHAQGVDISEARDIAHKVTRNVLGSERGTMDWHAMEENGVPMSGRLQQRSLTLPDKLLEPFLNSDIDHLSHSYLRSMAPEVEFTERFGSRDMKDQLDGVRDEYARLMEQAKAAGKDPAPLMKQQDAVIRDLSAIRDRLYGIYGAPKDPGSFMVRAGRMLRADNALRLLGAATLAHFPDLGNVIARYGMANTFGAIGKVLSSGSALKLAGGEAKRMGAALDMVMNVTASILGDYGSHSQFAEQRAMAKITRGFTIATGETPLITAVQALTSTLAQDELIRASERVASGQALGADRAARLASAGLDESMLKRFAAQSQFHQKVNGLRFGMTDQWTDQKAAAAFESAVLKEAHGVTLRPGAGDTPLFMSSELGKLILQFKTFAFASSRIVVNPMLQGIARGDSNAVQGLFALAFMGTASYVAKQKAANQPIELDNPKRLAMEVLDKSNLLGWASEVVFPALWQFGMKDLSRWSDRDPVETLGGPSAGTIASTFERQLPAKATADTEAGEKGFARSDLHFIRRLMPGQNLWYFRRGVNSLEDAVGDAFNLPGKSNADRAEENAQ